MKPSCKTTFSRKPQGQTEQVATCQLMNIVDLCFQAFKLDIKLEIFPIELQKIFEDEARERIVREVFYTTRMVAFISYYGNHMLLEIVFSQGGKAVKFIRIRFDFEQKHLIFIAEVLL